VDHRADHAERRQRDQPVLGVGADERVAVPEIVDADEQQGRERALDDRMAQAEDEGVGSRPQEEVGEAVGRAADEAQSGDEEARQGEQGLEHGGRRVVGEAAGEQRAGGLGHEADRDHRRGVRGPARGEREPRLGEERRAQVEPAERAGDAAPVRRGSHGSGRCGQRFSVSAG
jgi:hypothetical protein